MDGALLRALTEFYKSEEERSEAIKGAVENGASIRRTKSMMRIGADTRWGARNLKILLELGGSVHDVDDYGSTPLHIACLFANADVIELLLENGANTDAQDNDGLTPSMVFAQRLEQDKEMEMELGQPLPPEEGKNRERIQSLFADLHKK